MHTSWQICSKLRVIKLPNVLLKILHRAKCNAGLLQHRHKNEGILQNGRTIGSHLLIRRRLDWFRQYQKGSK